MYSNLAGNNRETRQRTRSSLPKSAGAAVRGCIPPGSDPQDVYLLAPAGEGDRRAMPWSQAKTTVGGGRDPATRARVLGQTGSDLGAVVASRKHNSFLGSAHGPNPWAVFIVHRFGSHGPDLAVCPNWRFFSRFFFFILYFH